MADSGSDSDSDSSSDLIPCDGCDMKLTDLLTKQIHELNIHGIFQDHLYNPASFDPFWDYEPPDDAANDNSAYVVFSEDNDCDVGSVVESSYCRPAIRPPDHGTAIKRLMKLVLDQHDDEKLMRRVAEAEAEDARRRVEEAEAAAAAEVARKKFEDDQEIERLLALKETTLPQEPPTNDEKALTIKVSMPDGSYHRRRFLRTHTMQCLFDYIDVCRRVKPGSYQVARLFPWQGFTDGDWALTFNELDDLCKEETFYVVSSKWS